MFAVVVWFCRSSSLAFLISAYLINLIYRFLLHWVICFGGYLFVHTPIFLKNTWIFMFFYLFHIWLTIMPKLWMSGVGTLCAIAHYRASLLCITFNYLLSRWKNRACLCSVFNNSISTDLNCYSDLNFGLRISYLKKCLKKNQVSKKGFPWHSRLRNFRFCCNLRRKKLHQSRE